MNVKKSCMSVVDKQRAANHGGCLSIHGAFAEKNLRFGKKVGRADEIALEITK